MKKKIELTETQIVQLIEALNIVLNVNLDLSYEIIDGKNRGELNENSPEYQDFLAYKELKKQILEQIKNTGG